MAANVGIDEGSATLSVFELAEPSLTFESATKFGPWKILVDQKRACEGELQPAGLSFSVDAATCPRLFAATPGQAIQVKVGPAGSVRKANVVLRLGAPATSGPAKIDQDSTTLNFGTAYEGWEVAWFARECWHKAEVDADGTVTLSQPHAAEIHGALADEDDEVLVYARDPAAADAIYLWEVSRAQAASPTATLPVSEAALQAFAGCLAEAASPVRSQVVCIDLTGTYSRAITVKPRSYVLRPNLATRVVVLHDQGEEIDVEMTGERGVEIPGLLSMVDPEGLIAHSGRSETLTYGVTERPIAPRRPGNVDLVIKELLGGTTQTRMTVELTVQKAYHGAVRIGLGMQLAPRERDYVPVPTPGGGAYVAEATEEWAIPAAAELVLGYSIFFNRGGRTYFGHRRRAVDVLGLYVGFGVLQSSESNPLALMRSYYVGLDIELNPHTSLVLAGGATLVQRLKAPLEVGGPIDPGLSEVPTKMTAQPGFAIVINLSPEFLKVARSATGASVYGS